MVKCIKEILNQPKLILNNPVASYKSQQVQACLRIKQISHNGEMHQRNIRPVYTCLKQSCQFKSDKT